jgi:hypothetical protein
MPLEHHPYVPSGKCQLSEPQKRSVGSNTMGCNTAFTNKPNKINSTLGLGKVLAAHLLQTKIVILQLSHTLFNDLL